MWRYHARDPHVTRARELGMRTMLGCMVESSVGISAAAQLLPLLDYVDLDGAELLARDAASGETVTKEKCDYRIDLVTESNCFLIGVQWHPEKLMPENKLQAKLFQAFIKAAKDMKNESEKIPGWSQFRSLKSLATGTAEQPDVAINAVRSFTPLGQLAAAAMLGGIIAGLYVFAQVDGVLDPTENDLWSLPQR